MKLYELLCMIDKYQFPLTADRYSIDSRPNTVYTVTLCFMAEEETWERVNIASELLIPWYECEVSSFNGSDVDNDIEVWLKDKEYIKKYWNQYIEWGDIDESN